MVVWGCARGATVARYLRGNRVYGALQCELLTVSGILWKQCFAASLDAQGPCASHNVMNVHAHASVVHLFENKNHGA